MSIVEKILGAYKKHLANLLLFSFVCNLLMFAVPIYSLQVFDRVISSSSKDTLLMLTIVIIVSFVGFAIIHFSRALIISSTNSWIEKNVSIQMLESSIYSSASGFKTAIGQHLRELNNIKNFAQHHAISFFFDVPWSLVFLLVIFLIHPYLGLIVMFGCMLIFMLALVYEKATHQFIEQSDEQFNKTTAKADEAAKNAESIVSMGMKKSSIANWEKEHKTYLELTDIVSYRSAYIMSILKFVRFVLQVMVLGVGVFLVLENDMTLGGVIATSILSARTFAPYESSIMSWKSFVEARKSYFVLKETFKGEKLEDSKINLPVPHGKLEIKKVSYILPVLNKPIIKNVSVNLPAGSVLGVIGKNAAGKTTLLKLMAGILKPTQGDIRLDGIDMYQAVREAGMGEYIGYMPQNHQLFNASVAENIARMKEPDSKEVVRVAKLLKIHEMILKMPDGYDTIIGTEGSYLSAGQRQSVALARAFYGQPKYILLDEPNTNLDNNGDNGLADAIKLAKKNHITTIVVSHTKGTLALADKLLVMDNGEMQMFGKASEVAKKLSGDKK